jgi:hypothetical protein
MHSLLEASPVPVIAVARDSRVVVFRSGGVPAALGVEIEPGDSIDSVFGRDADLNDGAIWSVVRGAASPLRHWDPHHQHQHQHQHQRSVSSVFEISVTPLARTREHGAIDMVTLQLGDGMGRRDGDGDGDGNSDDTAGAGGSRSLATPLAALRASSHQRSRSRLAPIADYRKQHRAQRHPSSPLIQSSGQAVLNQASLAQHSQAGSDVGSLVSTPGGRNNILGTEPRSVLSPGALGARDSAKSAVIGRDTDGDDAGDPRPAVVLVDPDELILDASARAARILGVSRAADVVGEGLSTLTRPADPDHVFPHGVLARVLAEAGGGGATASPAAVQGVAHLRSGHGWRRCTLEARATTWRGRPAIELLVQLGDEYQQQPQPAGRNSRYNSGGRGPVPAPAQLRTSTASGSVVM